MVRYKNPAVDLKLSYRKVLMRSFGISCLLLLFLALMFPTFEVEPLATAVPPDIVILEQIPETRQIRRVPPPRPAMPVETENDDVPEDVTIASTELDFERTPVDVPPPIRVAAPAVEEEVVAFWAVETQPELIRQVVPKYPKIARTAGLEGVVFVAFTVGTNGKVKGVYAVRGPEIFQAAAIEAVSQFVFKPAVQNDRPVSVKMTMPIRFRLRE